MRLQDILKGIKTDGAGTITTPYGVLPVDAYIPALLIDKNELDPTRMALVQNTYFEKQKDGTYLPLEKQNAK